MAPREQVYVRPEEDIHSIIDKIAEAESDEVELVIPSGARILQNIVDAYLLKDAISQTGKSVILVTNDVMGGTFADRAGIETVTGEDAAAAEFPASDDPLVEAGAIRPITAMARSPKKNTMSDITTKGRKSALKKNVASTKKTTASKSSLPLTKAAPLGTVGRKDVSESRFLKSYKQSKTDGAGTGNIRFESLKTGKKRTRRPISTGKIVAGILILALLVAGTVFAKVLPKAEVTIFPVRENQTFAMDVRVDQGAASINQEEEIIPGELLTEERTVSGDFPATGSSDPNDKVRGTITIYNESGESQTFVPSRFRSEGGLIFRTQQTVTIPAGTAGSPGTVSAQVVADGTGSQYAIGPSRFTMPGLEGSDLATKVYARSESAFSAPGGTGSKTVSEGDIESAYAALRTKAEAEINLRGNLPEGFVVWDEARNVELADRQTSRQAGESGETFTASVKVVERAIAFKQADLDRYIEDAILADLPEEKTILPKSKQVTFAGSPVVDYTNGTINASLQVAVDVIDKIDAESFRGAIVNKNQEEIKGILNSYRGIESTEVNLWPFWVGEVPSNKERVTVSIHGT